MKLYLQIASSSGVPVPQVKQNLNTLITRLTLLNLKWIFIKAQSIFLIIRPIKSHTMG